MPAQAAGPVCFCIGRLSSGWLVELAARERVQLQQQLEVAALDGWRMLEPTATNGIVEKPPMNLAAILVEAGYGAVGLPAIRQLVRTKFVRGPRL